MSDPDPLRDLEEHELRDAGSLKWSLDAPGTIPAWVAEMDFALAEPVQRTVQAYAARGVFGYADPHDRERVATALAGFAARQWGYRLDPARVLLTGDVMEGLTLTLAHVAPPGPVIVPTPVYPPFLVSVAAVGREVRAIPLVAQGDAADAGPTLLGLDLKAVEAQAKAGARTMLLCQPHNPVGRCWTREELGGLREVAEAHGVHVISDEIHAPLTLPGVEFVPYAAVASDEAALTTLISATKAFSMPGLRCAQIVSHRARDHERLRGLHPVLNHAMTTLGQRASITAYTCGDPWLEAVRERIAANHRRFASLLATDLPQVGLTHAQATYLAWLDVRSVEVRDPVAAALDAGVRVDDQGCAYGPGGAGHVRVNLATSPQRVTRMAQRLADAWG